MNELLRVENLKKSFKVNEIILQAVKGISFNVDSGQTIGLVGESGCGKSTAARCILRIIEPDCGLVSFKGIDVTSLKQKQLRPLRKQLQMVFQDPPTALNPRMKVKQLLAEPLYLFDIASGKEVENKIEEMISIVALEYGHLERFPHQLSGGQQQRVAIARALITEPELVVLDEPTASQDATVKVLLTKLLADLQEKLGVSYIFVSHDLSVVRNLCHRVIVMYLGSIVEEGAIENIFNYPLHPYTQALLSAVPVPDPELKREKIKLKGETPSISAEIIGCSFKERCSQVKQLCYEEKPKLRKVDSGVVACHFA